MLDFRESFLRGRVKLRIEPTTFRLADYRGFLREHHASIDTFKRRQQAAFEAERERWALLPPAPDPDAATAGPSAGGDDPNDLHDPILGPDEVAVRADVTSSVWQIAVEPGARVVLGDRLLVLESMKMEIPVVAPESGTVKALLVRPSGLVAAGQIVAILTRA